jgi:hypothetical protein
MPNMTATVPLTLGNNILAALLFWGFLCSACNTREMENETTISGATQSHGDRVHLKLHATREVYDKSEPILIFIEIVNASPVPISFGEYLPQRDFKVQVLSEGAELEKSPQGKEWEMAPASGRHRKLNTGDKIGYTINLGTLFELKQGAYSIRMKRSIYVGDSQVELTSNTLPIKIKTL